YSRAITGRFLEPVPRVGHGERERMIADAGDRNADETNLVLRDAPVDQNPALTRSAASSDAQLRAGFRVHTAPAGHVFISYVREDSHHVDRLQQTLEAAGVRVWRDTADLWPGEDWRAKIRHAITDDALVFLACFSNASRRRARSYQNEELALALDQMRLRRPD